MAGGRSGNDAEVLFRILVEQFGDVPVGNRQLQETVGWAQQGRFQRARDTLIAAGVVRVIPGGRGGRLALVQGKQTPRPDLSSLAAGHERELYPLLVPHLSKILQQGEPDDWTDNVPEENVAVAVTGDAGGAGSIRFGRPDLTGAVRRRLTRFDALEVHAFEVKGYWHADRTGIYEAAAQRAIGLCTHAWLVLYVPDDSVLGPNDKESCRVLRDQLHDLIREAAELGIGFIHVERLVEDGVHVRQLPHRYAADPKRLDDYLDQACPLLLNQIGIEPQTVVPF